MRKNYYNFFIVVLLIIVAASYYLGWDYNNYNTGQYIIQGILSVLFITISIRLLMKKFKKTQPVNLENGSPGLIDLYNNVNKGDKMNGKEKEEFKAALGTRIDTPPDVRMPINEPVMKPEGIPKQQMPQPPQPTRRDSKLFGSMLEEEEPIRTNYNVDATPDPADEIKRLEEQIVKQKNQTISNIRESIEKVNAAIVGIEKERDNIKVNIIKPLSERYDKLWDKKVKLQEMLNKER